MNTWLIMIVAFIYLIIGIKFLIVGKIGLGIVFISYAVSNYGLYLTSGSI